MDYAPFIYVATAMGAVAVLLMMPRAGYTPRLWGWLLGAITLGGMWLYFVRQVRPDTPLAGMAGSALPYYYIFSFIAIAAACRVISHTRPVYAALWFVMVILSSAGLFLTLSSEFMAIAMVIIYAGAILVTYMFVIMLASQSMDIDSDGQTEVEAPEYERVSREPFAAVVAGFLLLAVLLTVMFGDLPAPSHAGASDAQVIDELLINRAAARAGEQTPGLPASLVDPDSLDNVERVGLDLFEGHPLGIELAGIILLLSLIGAVVIARKRVEAEAEAEN